VSEALDVLEGAYDSQLGLDADEEKYIEPDIYIAPPDPGVLTDEDSDDEDNAGCIDNLSRNQLLAEAELKSPRFRISELQESFIGQKKRKWIIDDLEARKNDSSFKKFTTTTYTSLNPVEIFGLFFDEEIIQLILDESNRYLLQNNFGHKTVEKHEVYAFIEILLISEYNILPRQTNYWELKHEQCRGSRGYETGSFQANKKMHSLEQ